MTARPNPFDDLLAVALGAARAGAAVAMRRYRMGVRIDYETKARNDFVTAVDREAEAAIVGAIRSRFPRHAILAEEAEHATPGEEICWIIDPLDGTTNFIHGFPVFSVSVAAAEMRAPASGPAGNARGGGPATRPERRGEARDLLPPPASDRGRFRGDRAAPVGSPGIPGTPSSGVRSFAGERAVLDPANLVAGVVIDPLRDEIFSSTRGGGARLNGQPIRVSGARDLESCLLATGFPFRAQELLPAYLGIFEDLHKRTQGIRRPGSAALDLSYVAAGRVDGFFEFGLSPWDIAAGALIVSEAGGVVRGFTGGDDYLMTGHVVAGGPPITAAILDAIAKHYP